MLESYWYNRDGKTLNKYRFNQFAFLDDDTKYIRRNDKWLSSRIANGHPETTFQTLPDDVDPIEEIDVPSERRKALRHQYDHYETFSRNVLEMNSL